MRSTSGYVYYTFAEIADLLQKAKDLGFDLEEGSYLERLTIEELHKLVTVKQ